jgi:hypothetical protein
MMMKSGPREKARRNENAPTLAFARRRRSRLQRAATYIVISKPKRRSQAVGVVHCMKVLLVDVARKPDGPHGDRSTSRSESSPERAPKTSAATMNRTS